MVRAPALAAAVFVVACGIEFTGGIPVLGPMDGSADVTIGLVDASGDRAPGDASLLDDASDGRDADANACTDHALSFSGSGPSLAEYANGSVFDFRETEALTVEAWVRVESSLATSGEGHIVSHHSHSIIKAGWALVVKDGYFEFRVYEKDADGYEFIRPSARIKANQWVHVVAAADATADNKTILSIMQDSADGGERDLGGGFKPAVYAGPLRIGRSAYDLPVEPFWFRGLVDEVKISSAAISSAATYPLGRDAQTLALWHFDEGSGNLAAEAPGGNRSLLIPGIPNWVCHSP